MVAGDAGDIATVFLDSDPGSFFEGDEVYVTVVFVEGTWQAYPPVFTPTEPAF